MREVKVWDPVVRIFHWSTVAIVFINTLIFDEGDTHETLGYIVAGVLVVRILWGIVGTRYARFSNFFPTPARLREHLAHRSDREEYSLGHNPLGAVMIFNLIVALAAVSLTGHLMTTDQFWGVDWMEELHEGFVIYLLVSVAVHVAGVLFESIRTRVNLIAAMVTGKKKLN